MIFTLFGYSPIFNGYILALKSEGNKYSLKVKRSGNILIRSLYYGWPEKIFPAKETYVFSYKGEPEYSCKYFSFYDFFDEGYHKFGLHLNQELFIKSSL